jgi:murein DD-endopeptidase MepM/ murein hydrolase activator NlpD
MVSRFGSDRSSVLPRILVIGLVSGLAAACSSETMRFASDPFGNPFGSSRSEPAMTGSLGAANAAPAGTVDSAPLSAPSSAPQQIAAVQTAPAASQSRSTGPAGWTAQGGTPVMVRQGDTLTGLADRYNVPASAILSANGLARAADLQPGGTVVIPVYNAVGSQVASTAPVTASPQPAPQQVASAASAPTSAPPRRPQQLSQPTSQPAAQPAAPPQQVASASPTLPTSRPDQTIAAPQPSAQQQAPAMPEPTTTAALPSDAGGLDFRWPARGRVIAGFGTGGNEGINIAVPEGTPVRAAEGGTVAYAGSELKGYGNLVLIRHDNGFVSAYAHNSELLVKRGDDIRRGQVIANSGRTGNVNAPQLHFEIRKGSDPVDPMPYLRN